MQFIIYGIIALAVMSGIGWGYHTVKESGRTEIRAEWQAAETAARKREAEASAKAAADLSGERAKRKVVIQERTVYVDRNIEKLVDSGNCVKPAGVLCINGAINGDKSAAGCNADGPMPATKPAG